MPHVSSGSGGDDLGSTDEVKVFKDEGDGEDEKRSSENLTEEKSSLIDLTESEVHFCDVSFVDFSYLLSYTFTSRRGSSCISPMTAACSNHPTRRVLDLCNLLKIIISRTKCKFVHICVRWRIIFMQIPTYLHGRLPGGAEM